MRTRATTIALSAALWAGIAELVVHAGPTRTRIVLPADQPLTVGGPQLLAISPDGQNVVYVANLRLYRRRVSDRQASAVAGTDSPRGIFNPVFSPDGRSVAFWSAGDQALKRVPTAGGAPTTICQTSGVLGASWGLDDRIVFGAGQQGVMRVSARGGSPESIVTMKPGEFAAMPQMLPGGEAVVFTVGDASIRGAIETGFLEHVLEQRSLRSFFAHWARDERLQEAWRHALAWGDAHPNFTKGLREQLRALSAEDD